MAFGNYGTIALDTDLTAQQDIFLIVTITADNDGDRGFVLGEISHDGGSTWSTYASGSVHWYNPSDAQVKVNSFCLPVPKNALFRVRAVSTNGTTAVTANVITA